jgi:membrane protein implicated in regulation of membrane protease activity
MDLSVSLLSSPALWAGLFVLLMVIEVSTAGVFAGFMGIGALITAFFVQFFGDASTQAIVLTFFASTCISAVVLWKPLKKRYLGRDTTDAEEGIEPFTNDFGTVEGEGLTSKGGHIRLHGARMRAVLSPDAGVESIEAGSRVQVVRQDVDQRFVVIPES